MPAFDEKLLYKNLVELEVVDRKKLDAAWKQSAVDKLPFDRVLLDRDLIGDENLGKIMADTVNMPFIRLATVAIPETTLKIIPEVVAKKQRVVAFSLEKDGLKLAMVNPDNREFLQFVSKKTGLSVFPYLATARDVEQTLGLYKKDLQKTFDQLLTEQVNMAEKGTDKEAPVYKIVDLLIEYAYVNRASDIHIEPERKQSLVRFRIDGVLHDVLVLPKILHEQVVSKIKVSAKLRTDERMSAQDGKMQMKLEDEELDIRVSIVPIVNGEKVVMRLLSSRARQFSLEELGMEKGDLKKVEDGFSKPYGMVLSTGPTGSGKTTTIYTILKQLNIREVNIATIEDPVEYDIGGINQIQVNPKTNLTFANGLRAILRQDPNVIFVGEIRDQETADIAVNSAMTGHLVLSTLHTNDAATTLPRLIDMGVEPFLVASTVNVIIGQRLVRKVCQKCRVSEEMDIADLAKHFQKPLIEKYWGKVKQARVYYGKGCPVCHNTGYISRVGIFEVLVVSDKIKELITAKADSDMITKQAVTEGMRTMTEDGADKVQQGITTIDEVVRVTRE